MAVIGEMMRKLLLILICLLYGCTDQRINPQQMVIDYQPQDSTYEYLDQYLDSFLHDGDQLLNKFNDETITWEITDGNATIEDNIIHKTSLADEYEKIVLQANIKDKSYRFDNLCLLDKIHGYLITYFSDDDESLKLAYTYDGLLWYELNHQESVLEATIGTKSLRDPSVVRNKNGGFYLLATQGYDTDSIYVWDTDDFVTFNNERLLKVNTSTSDLKLKEEQAWAPEGFYDRRIDKYVIYWSSPSDQGMYLNYTSDFNDLSYPQLLLDPGFPVIDGTIYKDGYEYNIVLKDERQPMEQYSQLFVGYSDSDYLGFDEYNMDYITGHQSEGPFIIDRGYSCILYYDDYTRMQFKAIWFQNFRDHDFADISHEMVTSVTNVKHGNAIALTYKEFERFSDIYEIS
ncbi:MAG: hypothetical protein MR210_08645 [Erysipelotrichaceae bacterium]|nr:hypothetical protein [Erysipelotrichaceae bacterium]